MVHSALLVPLLLRLPNCHMLFILQVTGSDRDADQLKNNGRWVGGGEGGGGARDLEILRMNHVKATKDGIIPTIAN